MIKNRKLTDLFVRGKEITIGDDDGPIKVWLQKLNSAEHEAIIRHANAARARTLASKNDSESEEYQAIAADVLELDKDEMVDLVIASDLVSKMQAIESEISEKEEWLENGYLQGLRDAWEEGLAEEYALDQSSEEASKVFSELKRFAAQVDEGIIKAQEDLTADHLERSLDSLFKDAMEAKILAVANVDWLKAYRKGELVYACREVDDHKKRMLDWNSIDELQQEAFERLLSEYRDIDVDVVEGKD